jgi:ornithine cyclodeaminase
MPAVDGDLLILNGREVDALLAGRERELIEAVRESYELHSRGESSLPHSTFLNFSGDSRNRIIALPAYLGGDAEVAGLKWIASFPGNVQRGLDRASAVIVLNSMESGRPEAILEGSLISAKRTAASAALAARHLHGEGADLVGLVGCGMINFEVLRSLRSTQPRLGAALVFDQDAARAGQFTGKVERSFGGLEVRVARDVEAVLGEAPLVSFATTAPAPHVADLSACPPRSTILHVSLRDLSPEAVLSSDNVVDDVDHVCRARTSVHLAEQLAGHRDFIRCTIADVTSGAAAPRRDDTGTVVFSPFGLGILDLAVARLACRLAVEQNRGSTLGSFLPESWLDRD